MTRQQFLQILGPLPQKTALQPEIQEEVDCGGYLMQKLIFYAETNDPIPAYLLLPKNRLEYTPAIYCHHQHGSNWNLGKSEVVGLAGDPNLAYAKELAERGFITLAPDAIAFEERQNQIGGSNGNYFEMARRLVHGQTLLGKVLFDISVGIDYLASRPEVDIKRIGFIGHSYGGRMAIFAPVFDRRIRASVSNCGCVNYKDSIAKAIGIQLEFCVHDILKYGDVEDVIRLIEPCSLLISATSGDKFSLGADRISLYAAETFKQGELLVKIYEGEHIFSEEMREVAYGFLGKYL